MNTSMIDYYFGKFYEEEVIKNSDSSKIISTFKHKLEANQSLKAEAQKLLATLTDSITKKCFTSKKKKDFLTKALEAK